MENLKTKLKQAWDDNPLAVIAVGTGAVLAVSKLLNSATAYRNSRTWQMEVQRRAMNHR